jgi:hypothetical protein
MLAITLPEIHRRGAFYFVLRKLWLLGSTAYQLNSHELNGQRPGMEGSFFKRGENRERHES